MCMVCNLLTALGNRIWGDAAGTHFLGLAIMSLGIWLAQASAPLWWMIPICAGVELFRVWSPRPFFWVVELNQWGTAFKRAAWVVVLGAIMSLLHHSIFPYLKAVAGVVAIPVIYWGLYKFSVWFNAQFSPTGYFKARIADKGFVLDYAELAECIIGCALCIISL